MDNTEWRQNLYDQYNGSAANQLAIDIEDCLALNSRTINRELYHGGNLTIHIDKFTVRIDEITLENWQFKTTFKKKWKWRDKEEIESLTMEEVI